jgi:hypothetical protein
MPPLLEPPKLLDVPAEPGAVGELDELHASKAQAAPATERKDRILFQWPAAPGFDHAHSRKS